MKNLLKTKLARRITGLFMVGYLFFAFYSACQFDVGEISFGKAMIIVLLAFPIEWVSIKILEK